MCHAYGKSFWTEDCRHTDTACTKPVVMSTTTHNLYRELLDKAEILVEAHAQDTFGASCGSFDKRKPCYDIVNHVQW